ncbi:glycolipid transfer protein domain-containing protein [Pseudomassariella vexata]|uniref:Glycolipid transfer protein domain-containing protein n=1 Tax=Pseudomassariella vexata TaxID=1141098 RepID=A0A1Y2DKC6_9PEZI|nr:glycolipid transfer protein domain-containing protein [Pseudomassariella vexata]ORY59661.1 glycolipid transfer protein domain-containing protein [Pseudomassariella vexata]
MSAPSFPPGGTLLDTFKKSFIDVPVDANKDNAISTTEFLEAAESLTTIFDALGSTAFSPVKSDMLGNVKKIRDRLLEAPADSATLQDLVKNDSKGNAVEALAWLNRGLDFTCKALSKNVANANEELSDSFREAYGQTLKPYHGMLVKPVFSLAMSACPYRKVFYEKLGDDTDKVQNELRPYLASLEKIVSLVKGFLPTKYTK